MRTAFPPALLLGKNIRVWVELTSVDVALGGSPIVRGVTAGVDAGDLVVVVGPNGAGKTTLVRAIAGLVEVSGGSVRCFGRDPSAPDRRTLAKELAYLPQHYELAFPFVVEEVVLLGRYARQRGLGLASADDLAAAERAMAATDVTALRARRFDELSGGEARRVILAQALCQGARCLLLDEPTAGLDPAHARGVFEMLRAHCEGGAAAIVVTHDLDLALRYGRTMSWSSAATLTWRATRGSSSSRRVTRCAMW
ncbi:MAG TPA: ABC transporter ATP-binding protein, partial [Kofleriaceae bacterium]|nr:ABC transporter ATP-binding protein [Kofleriaceae bacterium]